MMMKAFILFLCSVILFGFQSGFAQISKDNFNLFFENNFNDDHSGRYLHSEYIQDWNLPSSSSLHSKEIIDIIKDSQNGFYMRGYFPKGTYLPDNHGWLWSSHLKTPGTELYFSYDIRFKAGFNWVQGGKIPGLTGGKIVSGRAPTKTDGFSTRMMWKQNGKLVFYVYHQNNSIEYGDSYPWNGFLFSSGKWYNLTIRVVLNSFKNGVAQNDGILEGFVDGKLMFQKTNFKFRSIESILIDNLYICSFFGGGTDDWAAARDEWIDTDNYIAYTYSSKATNVPKGYTKSSWSKTLLHPYYNFSSAQQSTPQAPKSLSSSSQTTSSIDIKWLDNSNNEQQFILYRSLSLNDGFIELAKLSADKTSYTDASVKNGTTYYYKLRAYNQSGYSDFTDVLKVSTKTNQSTVSSKVYIDPENISDSLADGTIEHPFDSWEDVTWKSGNSYLQKRGTKTKIEKIVINANSITIGAYGEGSLPIISSSTSNYLIVGFEKSGININNLNLEAPNAISCIYFLGNSNDSITIEHCQLKSNISAIKVINTKSLAVKYNAISSTEEGVYSSALNNFIYYNIFKNCQAAMNITGNEASARIYNNVFYNNEESLLATYASIILYNNIFYMTTSVQRAINQKNGSIQSNNNIYYPEHPGFIIVSNKVYSNLKQLQNDKSIDINSFISDPYFVDIYNNNFNLDEKSPAIDKGKNLNITSDISGNKVPISNNADIGVFEYSKMIPLPEELKNLAVEIYPNPCNGIFNIVSKTESQEMHEKDNLLLNEIVILDMTGKAIYQEQLDGFNESFFEKQFDLSDISSGIYVVIIKIAGKISKSKLVISK